MLQKLITMVATAAALLVTTATAQAELNIVASTPEIAALVREVGGDRVSVVFISKPNQDPHFVDAKPSFMVHVNRAKALFYTGLELEMAWLPLLIQGARNPGLVTVDLSESIQVRDKPSGPVSRAQGDVHPLGNPHYWYDPRNGEAMARTIAAALQRIDPGHAAAYGQNLSRFLESLRAKLPEWTAQLEPFRGTKVIQFHPKWSYFAQWAGLEIANDVESKPGIPPSAAHVKALLDQVAAERIALLLQDGFNDPKVGEFLSRKTGIRVLSIPTSVGAAEGTGTWFAYFDNVVASLAAALNQP